MPRTRPPYSPGLRRQIVVLVRAGQGPEELPRDFEPTTKTIHSWMRQTGMRAKTAVQAKSVGSYVARATVWFARETEAVPPKDSDS